MVRVYTIPVRRIKHIFITLLTTENCPFCKVAKRELEWFKRELYPYFHYTSRSIGTVEPNLEYRSYEALTQTSFDIAATEYAHQIGEAEHGTPVTVIGDLTNPDDVRFGCDKFGKYPKEAIQKLPKQMRDAIESGAFDGVSYSNYLYDRHIQETTGIVDKKIVDALNLRLKKSRQAKALLKRTLT